MRTIVVPLVLAILAAAPVVGVMHGSGSLTPSHPTHERPHADRHHGAHHHGTHHHAPVSEEPRHDDPEGVAHCLACLVGPWLAIAAHEPSAPLRPAPSRQVTASTPFQHAHDANVRSRAPPVPDEIV